MSIFNYASYPARFTNYKLRNASAQTVAGNVAFRRSFFDLTKMPVQTTSLRGMSIQGTVTIAGPIVLPGASVLFEACTLVMDLATPGPENRRNAFFLDTGAQITLVNCNVIILAATTGTYYTMFLVQDGTNVAYSGTTGFKINAYGNNFIFNGANGLAACENDFIAGDTNTPSGSYNFVGNNYYHVGAANFSYKADRTTLADWTTNCDTTAIAVNPGFVTPTSVDPAVAGKLNANSALYSHVARLAKYAPQGRNSRPYSGLIGDQQAGGGGGGGGAGAGAHSGSAALQLLEIG